MAERQFPRRGSAKPYRVRTLSLDAAGAPVGPPQDLGLGEFGIDARPTQALAVLPDGRAVLVFQRERISYGDPQPVVYAVRPHGGTFTTPAVVGDKLTDARVTVAGDRAVLTATMTALCGDTSCAGQPRAIPLNPDGSLGTPVGPTVARASRAFAPWAAPGAIVFQLKSAPKPFSREAPDPRRRAHPRRPAADADAPARHRARRAAPRRQPHARPVGDPHALRGRARRAGRNVPSRQSAEGCAAGRLPLQLHQPGRARRGRLRDRGLGPRAHRERERAPLLDAEQR